jgi:hypothetical protein
MKRCLDGNELMRLWAAEPAELPDLRAHLAQCPRCTADYAQLARDAGTITDALTVAADHLKRRDRAATHGAHAHIGYRTRGALVFSGAAAFGGAAAFALMLALGWQPAGDSTQLAGASADTAVAAESSTTALPNAGSLYAVDAIVSDPLTDLGYGGAVRAAANPGEDLLFCVPDDDGSICDSSAEQG